MWLSSGKGSNNSARRNGRNGVVAVAIDKDKRSQDALKWATEHLINKGQSIILIHVVPRPSTSSLGKNYAIYEPNGVAKARMKALEKQHKELFLSFHCFCTRKDINCFDVLLEETDIARAISDYAAYAAVENLVLGSSRHGFIKLKVTDVPSSVSKSAPDFCTVYVISKAKISSVRNASRAAPFVSPVISHLQKMEDSNPNSFDSSHNSRPGADPPKAAFDDSDLFKSPFSRGRGFNGRMFAEISENENESFAGSDRTSTDRLSGVLFDSQASSRTSRASTCSDNSFTSTQSGPRGSEASFSTDFSSSSVEGDDVDAEMRRLKQELQRTMEMYSTACKQAQTSKHHKAAELSRWRAEEERRMEEARLAEESARQEKAKYSVGAAQRIADMESRKRVSAEMKAISEESDESESAALNYRRYSIDEIEEATHYFSKSLKVGEGGYGPVFKCNLDHTPVAVKVLRPDAAQGRSQFQQELQVLSCMRHPNMVLLLGACPEYGCLVYEYMANGSLEDRLCRKGNTRALSWQLRFRIAAEIATGLNFLHQMKPEPLVHRDLKPANILLDQNYVSKISDVGLARLVPPSVADDTTQYLMTSTAGTFCYIDPEYQQTGMLGVKSDVYSFGVLLLQLLTAKSPMGLTHTVGRAIEKGKLEEMLDPAVPDWPIEEAGVLAQLAVQCAEMRRKDRPDLAKVVLPEFNRLRDLANQRINHFLV
ncbi:LOW QUALITY PROTEIN: U-box domain-containing protein 51-like [Salvia miltiorrhiza]|uniref:LOW QUALITY PROTEIN: U-box domain-containing protein 51-like n=1 Tax=Salvia miltiorrhiza TaxID=226208 RepID=UPI0025AC99D8|nr:LOW QUALITY PROTEIN: U-box domain-containing protein 51-like [Salvia miltiorrhiza]